MDAGTREGEGSAFGGWLMIPGVASEGNVRNG
jgi:hypothetical protein